jgi:hypothetical protein
MDKSSLNTDSPWKKPSLAFFHLADRWKSQGFPSPAVAASCGSIHSARSAHGLVFMVIVAVLVCAGCSGESFRTAEVSGTVTNAGRPAAGVFVQFSPPGGYKARLPSAYGMTDAQGRYRLVRPGSKTGAVVGPNTVTFSTIDADAGTAPTASGSSVAKWSFEVDVKPGSNTFDFPISDDPSPGSPPSR